MWFERKFLKITYSIGADFDINDYSTIVIIRVNNKTGKLEVISNYSEKNCSYRDFFEQVYVLSKQYNTNDVLRDLPREFMF